MTKYFLINNASRAAAYGIGTFIKSIIPCLHSSFSDMELCLLDFDSEVREFETYQEDGVWHYRIPAARCGCNSMDFYRSVLFLLEPYLEKDSYVIFHFNYTQHFPLMRLIKAKYPESRIIYTVHYQNWCFSLKGNLTKFRKIVSGRDSEDKLCEKIKSDFLEEKCLYSLCDDVLVLCQFTYDLLKKDYGVSERKLHLVRNGMPPVVVRSAEREGLAEKNVLFVGRLDDIKGIDYTIKAFKIVCERHTDAHLTLVGDGKFSYFLALCDGIWDRVTFTGKLPREKLEHFFKHATIGVQASFHEQCSYSAMEMMAHGIPLVATDSTGLAEMMSFTPWNMVHIQEENFLEESFITQLSDRMDALLSNPNLREKSSEKLLELFYKRYSVDQMSKALEVVNVLQNNQVFRLSEEFLPYIDEEMIRILTDCPVIDLDNIGLTGIGCYLCWRLGEIGKEKTAFELSLSAKLRAGLSVCVDLIEKFISAHKHESFTETFDSKTFCWLLEKMQDVDCSSETAFRISRWLQSQKINFKAGQISVLEIEKMAMEIYNANF